MPSPDDVGLPRVWLGWLSNRALVVWAAVGIGLFGGNPNPASASTQSSEDEATRTATKAANAAVKAIADEEGSRFSIPEMIAEIPSRASVSKVGQECSLYLRSGFSVSKSADTEEFNVGFGGKASPTLSNADKINLSIILFHGSKQERMPAQTFRYIELQQNRGTFFTDMPDVERFAKADRVAVVFGEYGKEVVSNDLTHSTWGIAELKKCIASLPH